jgi:hypothetical protein
MRQVIIYPNDDNSLSVVALSPECGLSVTEVARKDVPVGKPYHILDSDQLPQDNIFFTAWEANFSDPDGYGIGAEAWFAEQSAKEQS